MSNELLAQLQAAQQELDPQFKALRDATGALKQAVRLAGEEKLDALAMQKALTKLQQASQAVDNAAMTAATDAFTAQTQSALDGLAFDFAKDLKETFEQRGESVEGRPPTLVVGSLVLNIDIAARKAQWLYGKEALTRPIPLSINNLIKAYDQQQKRIVARTIDTNEFVTELYTAWNELVNERDRRPSGGRINIVAVYSKLTLNRQSARFWNAPARNTFKDYERPLFVRDMVLANQTAITVDGEAKKFRLGVATKSHADNSNRSIWLPSSALDGEYYSDITFDAN